MNPVEDHLPLRDIHLPEPVPWWPPAPGWWLLLLLLAAVVALAVFLRHRYSRKAVQRAARQALRQIGDAYRQSGDSKVLVQQLSMWLRRVTLSRYPRQEVAGLTGCAWLRPSHFRVVGMGVWICALWAATGPWSWQSTIPPPGSCDSSIPCRRAWLPAVRWMSARERRPRSWPPGLPPARRPASHCPPWPCAWPRPAGPTRYWSGGGLRPASS